MIASFTQSFETAPRDAGQIVTRSWALASDGFVLRVADRSDGSVGYFFHALTAQAKRTEWEFHAVNGSPISQGLAVSRSRKISEAEAMKLV